MGDDEFAAQLQSRIYEIVQEADLETVTAKDIRMQLGVELGKNLEDQKAHINKLINQAILDKLTKASSHDLQLEAQPDASNTFSKQEELERIIAADYALARQLQEQSERRLRTSKGRERQAKDKSSINKPKRLKRAHKSGASSPFNKPLLLSPMLQSVINKSGEIFLSQSKDNTNGVPAEKQTRWITELSRPQVVKHLWTYIKANSLQDPNDRRYILCDDLLQGLFKKTRVSCFALNKHLIDHLKKKEDVVPVEDSPGAENDDQMV